MGFGPQDFHLQSSPYRAQSRQVTPVDQTLSDLQAKKISQDAANSAAAAQASAQAQLETVCRCQGQGRPAASRRPGTAGQAKAKANADLYEKELEAALPLFNGDRVKARRLGGSAGADEGLPRRFGVHRQHWRRQFQRPDCGRAAQRCTGWQVVATL